MIAGTGHKLAYEFSKGREGSLTPELIAVLLENGDERLAGLVWTAWILQSLIQVHGLDVLDADKLRVPSARFHSAVEPIDMSIGTTFIRGFLY